MESIQNTKVRNALFGGIFFAAFLGLPAWAHAASLYFSPTSGSYAVGTSFSVNVYAESTDQSMNAASGVVSFPWDKLEVISISKQGSIFSLWPAEPSFSNSAGTVNFEGIVLNPGYIGSSGKILTITFRARSEGQANLSLSSGSVLANDGTGTNILDGLRVATFSLGGAQQPVTEQSAPQTAENELSITSSTHPDQSKWYINNTPEFDWELPEGALEVRTLIGKSSRNIPSVSYKPPISRKKVDELSDGTYYFAVRVRTAEGWGPISRYRVNIDTTPPKPFLVTFPHGNAGLDPQPVVFFNTTDGESGVSHYDIKIGVEGKPIRSAPLAASNPYVLPIQRPGTYTLAVTAVDNAGNMRESSVEFTVEGIEPPTITYYPESIETGDLIKIRGTTYANAKVDVYVREGDRLVSEEPTKSNPLGDFVLIVTKGLDPGVYTFTARVTDERGAQSVETAPLTISVTPRFISGLIEIVLKYVSVAILVLLAIGGIAGLGAYLWLKIPRVLRHMRREAREAEKVSEKAFRLLRKDIVEHIARLKTAQGKRKLTAEELSFLERFEQELEEAEEIIVKEIRDVSRS